MVGIRRSHRDRDRIIILPDVGKTTGYTHPASIQGDPIHMTVKNLFLASLLLSITLLSAGPSYAAPLYFPHVATIDGWQTEIAVINTCPD